MTILIITINKDFFEKTINKGLTQNTTKGAYLSIMIIKKKLKFLGWAQLTIGENRMGFDAKGIKAGGMGSTEPIINGATWKMLVQEEN